MSEVKTDLLIIGGGIAGCIAAIALSDRFQVMLIDKLPQPLDRIGESLAPASGRILSQLNLWRVLESQAGVLFHENQGMCSFWGSDRPVFVDGFRNPDGLAKNLDRKAFEQFLRRAAEEKGIQCYWGVKLESVSSEDSGWKVVLCPVGDKPEKWHVSADFVIDASGRQSHFARSLGIKRQIIDKLIACWITINNTSENTMSSIIGSENGWWYSCVVPHQKRIISFHTDADLMAKNDLKTLDSFLVLAAQNNEIQTFITGNESSIEFHGTVAANSSILTQVAGKNWAAIGDAAISFDPLSSQGIFNAMASAMQLRDLIQHFGFTEELIKKHTSETQAIWTHYLQHKQFFYEAETRWKTAEFWKRRQQIIFR